MLSRHKFKHLAINTMMLFPDIALIIWWVFVCTYVWCVCGRAGRWVGVSLCLFLCVCVCVHLYEAMSVCVCVYACVWVCLCGDVCMWRCVHCLQSQLSTSHIMGWISDINVYLWDLLKVNLPVQQLTNAQVHIQCPACPHHWVRNFT